MEYYGLGLLMCSVADRWLGLLGQAELCMGGCDVRAGGNSRRLCSAVCGLSSLHGSPLQFSQHKAGAIGTFIFTLEETEVQRGPLNSASKGWSPDLNPGGLLLENVLVILAQNRIECWLPHPIPLAGGSVTH